MNVKGYLIKKSIQPGRVETIGYGETRAIALNSTIQVRPKIEEQKFIFCKTTINSDT